MKIHILTVFLLSLTTSASIAQKPADPKLFLAGAIIRTEPLDEKQVIEFNQHRSSRPQMRILQFEKIPTVAERQVLFSKGIELLEYIPDNAYTAIIRSSLALSDLRQSRVSSMTTLKPEQKMQPGLAKGTFPPWSVVVPGTIDCWISFPISFTVEQVRKELALLNVIVTDDKYVRYRILAVRLAPLQLKDIASSVYIDYIQPVPRKDEVLNTNSRSNSQAKILQDPSGRGLTGAGVVVGVGDNSDPLQNIDYSGRVINRSSAVGGYHGTHVMGTVGGAGIIEENYMGFAPKSTILSQSFSNILTLSPDYVTDFGMVITNNSYGNVVNDCSSFGIYDLYSRVTDQQMLDLPHLQHVFAAGNSGYYSCGYAGGLGTVLGAYQSSKNIISVGNGNGYQVINTESSKGPVKDGRIKPELSAQGTGVFSTGPGDSYFSLSGTSMSAPAVSGGLALLYQRYRQLHGNADPANALMKALLINGATDKGNAGPDFSYGFGWMNLYRSVRMLEQQNYFTAVVAPAGTSTHTLTIPAGANIALMKVMLYWNDPAASPLASHSLVNDLDLEVITPSSSLILPQVLDTTAANVNNPAVPGADHINNVEQVLIANPAPGTYTMNIKGYNVTSGGVQAYTLVFDTIPVSTTLTFPKGGEHLRTSETISIAWESYGYDANTFTLQFSDDNGLTWSTVQSGLPGGNRIFVWGTPAVATDVARLKLIHDGTGIEDITGPFTVVGVPTLSLSGTQCAGYTALEWTAVASATDYEVMQLKGNEMQSVAVVNTTGYTIAGLSPDSLYYFSVRARINGKPGYRATAVSRSPSTGTCAGSISNNDLRLAGLVSPAASGRLYTSTALSASTVFRVAVRNLDDVIAAESLVLSYRINGGAWVTETFASPAVAAGTSKEFSFSVPANLSAAGTYQVDLALSYPSDPVLTNDSTSVLLRQIDNVALNLATAHVDDFEAMPVKEYSGGVIGLDNALRFDFSTSTSFGRLRSFVNNGIAIGTRGLTLDSRTFNPGGTIDTLKATYNLSGYLISSDDIRLDFQFKHHGQGDHPANKCWIRGSDTDPWIAALDLDLAQGDPGVFQRSPSIEVSDLLAAAGQQLSSSFQVRWGQFGQHLTADNIEAAGYTFDEIRIYRVTDDIQLVRIESPVVSGCGLDNAVAIRINVRNSASSPVVSIPVKYQVDGGAISSGVISSIGADASLSYTFPGTADLAAFGPHDLIIWSELASDSYHLNDTLRLTVYNSPLVTSFPYLQNFESGNGDWYTAGRKSSWEYGTPASIKIKGAASGAMAWKTRLAGNYNDGENSYLYSPCFNLSGMTNPTLSMSIALDLEDCGASLCDGAWVEYTTDGISWYTLGASGSGTNWYNRVYGGEGAWSVQNYTRWHVATTAIPTGMDMSRTRFRLVMKSDPYVALEGIAIDDIHIYDNVKGIYTGPSGSAEITRASVTGSSWIDFESGGKLVASINPMGQNLGSTDARVYINTGAVRNDGRQYYHNRNITIKPAVIVPAGPVKVRFYFMDSETDSLIYATGCPGCSKPANAYQLGVSKYSDTDDAIENGTIADNVSGLWNYITPTAVTKVPFDSGYYAEFEVNSFSEFWLNNGGPGGNTVLPVELLSFTAEKTADEMDVVLEWTTTTEKDLRKFVIEVARTEDGLSGNAFSVLGELAAAGTGNTTQLYRFTDTEADKNGVRYYRLKMIDRDGRFTYSDLRPVIFRNAAGWKLYPNPSATGKFNLAYQAVAGETVIVRVHDLMGKLIMEKTYVATGFVQKAMIDLSAGRYVAGVYLCEVVAGDRRESFRLFKK